MFELQKSIAKISKLAVRGMLFGYVGMLSIYAISAGTNNMGHWLFWVSLLFLGTMIMILHLIKDKCDTILDNEARRIVDQALTANPQLKKDIEFVTGKELTKK